MAEDIARGVGESLSALIAFFVSFPTRDPATHPIQRFLHMQPRRGSPRAPVVASRTLLNLEGVAAGRRQMGYRVGQRGALPRGQYCKVALPGEGELRRIRERDAVSEHSLGRGASRPPPSPSPVGGGDAELSGGSGV